MMYIYIRFQYVVIGIQKNAIKPIVEFYVYILQEMFSLL